MKRFQPARLSGVLVSFAVISGGCTSVAAAAMGDSEAITMVGGVPMYPSKNITQNVVNSKDHTTPVAAVKAGGLAGTLPRADPFIVFVPINEAFVVPPIDTVDKLLRPENKPALVRVLACRMMPGRLAVQDLMKTVADDGGKTMLETVEDDPLTVMQKGDYLIITDNRGGVAMVTIGNVYQSNGVTCAVNKVLML